MMLSVAPISMGPLPPGIQPFVLLVDDHEPSLETLRLVVEGAGFYCVARTCSREALDYCHSRRPALVVTDLAMPHLDGRELAGSLKLRYPTTPIVLVTGEALDEDSLAAFAGTFAGVFEKPLRVESFLTLVEGLMAG